MQGSTGRILGSDRYELYQAVGAGRDGSLPVRGDAVDGDDRRLARLDDVAVHERLRRLLPLSAVAAWLTQARALAALTVPVQETG